MCQYNIDGVVIDTVIFTMHEKSCIDLLNDIWKIFQKFAYLAARLDKLWNHQYTEFLKLS